MRLKKLQEYLKQKKWKYQYTEMDGLGSIDWEYRGLMYHVWEFSDDSVESNVRSAGKMEEFLQGGEEKVISEISGWEGQK